MNFAKKEITPVRYWCTLDYPNYFWCDGSKGHYHYPEPCGYLDHGECLNKELYGPEEILIEKKEYEQLKKDQKTLRSLYQMLVIGNDINRIFKGFEGDEWEDDDKDYCGE